MHRGPAAHAHILQQALPTSHAAARSFPVGHTQQA